jgi:hypothetical protein
LLEYVPARQTVQAAELIIPAKIHVHVHTHKKIPNSCHVELFASEAVSACMLGHEVEALAKNNDPPTIKFG